MSFYPEPDIHIKDKFKVVLDLLDYVTKRRIKRCCKLCAYNLAAKRDFIALKAGIDKLDINELVNVSTDLNNVKSKVDELDVGKLKTVPIVLSDVVSKEVAKKAVYNKLNTEIPDASILIRKINTTQMNKIWIKKLLMLIKKHLTLVVWRLLFLIQKLEKLRTKYQLLGF